MASAPSDLAENNSLSRARETHMFILFDSNVWFSQLGLQSRSGAAVRHFALRQGATVVVPEIVRLEIEERLTGHLLKLRKQAADSHKQLLQVFHKLQRLTLPLEEDIRGVVSRIVSNFDVPVREVEFNVDVARSSMIKIIRRIPPSKTKEEFRDGVIWAHCLELLQEGDVFFVTQDTDFYEQKSYEKGLASELVSEMKECSDVNRVLLKKDLNDLLSEIRVPMKLSMVQIFESIRDQEGDAVTELLLQNGFETVGSVRGEVHCFATDNADQVYFDFRLIQSCRDSTGAGRTTGELKLKGTGFLDPKTNCPTEVTLSNVLLDYPDWKPGGTARGMVFASGSLNAPEFHRVRIPLDLADEDVTNS